MGSRYFRIGVALSVVLLVAGIAASRASAQGGEPGTFAIKGAKVIPVSGPPIENGNVVVAKGVIVAVGKDAAIPADAWVIDGTGLTVYPGLFDAYTDVGIPAVAPPQGGQGGGRGQQQEISRGPEDRPGTTPWRSAADEVSLADKRIDSWRNGGFTTVMSAPKGGLIPGQGAVLDLAGARAGDLVVKAPVAIPINLQPIGGWANFPDSLMGAIAYIHQVLLDTAWSTQADAVYDKNAKGIARPPYDRTEAVMAQLLADHAIVLLPANNSVQIRRALVLADQWKLMAAIYGGQEGYETASEIAAKKMPVLVNLKWPEAEKDADPEDVPSLRTLQFRDKAPSAPAALEKAGVKFAFYSGGLATPKEMIKAAKKSVDAGLAPDAALRAMTLSPAEIYNVSDRLGSIERGKIANLMITDGDLFTEKTKIKLVFVDGKRFETHEPAKPLEPPKGDVTGTWKLTYTTPEGAEESTADLTMASDGTLSGTMSSKRGTASIFNGTVSGDKFDFTINIPVEGNPADVNFSGTFEKNSMKGTISVAGFSIDFSGTKPIGASTLSTHRENAAELQGGAR